MQAGASAWRLTVAKAVLIFGLTVVVYRPALRAGFIWDDDDHLTANPAMTATNGLHLIWSSLPVARYYPLTLTSFWVGHRLWGLNPRPYHAANILLHAVNAVLLLLLLYRLRLPGAGLAAALWAVHPVCVESVAWITELKNVQSAFFFLLALHAYLQVEERPSAVAYVLMLGCAAAAMLSKSSTIVLPGVILLLIWWRRGRWERADWWRLAPLLAGGLLMAGWTVMEQRYQIQRDTQPQAALNFLERLLLAAQALWFYLGKLLWPVNLSFIYPHWQINAHALSNWLPLLGVAGVGGLLAWQRRQPWARAGLFGLGYFTLALLPVMGWFDMFFFRYSFVADHFQYLAAIGPVALVAAGVNRWLRPRAARVTVAAVSLTLLSGAAWQYAHAFQDAETLWETTLERNPSAWLAHNNLAVILVGQDRLPEAAVEYSAALELNPTFAEGHSNYGNLLARQQKFPEAAAEQLAAIHCNPNYAGAYYNLGNLRALEGRWAEAIAAYQTALRLHPGFREAQFNLNLALKRAAPPGAS